jgi:arthrofactin-type cyclic lipopeptide synthetase C
MGDPTHAPIFCIPGAGNSAIVFNDFATAVGSTWPVIGLNPRGLDDELPPHTTIEAAASNYVRAISEIHTGRPIHLLGHSFGGLVAFEVALRLKANNSTIASLTLLDSEPPSTTDDVSNHYSASETIMELIDALEMTAQRSLGITSKMMQPLTHKHRLELLHSRMVRVNLMPARSRPEALRGVVRTFSAALRSIYRPQQRYLDIVRLVLVPDARVSQKINERRHEERFRAWRRWAPNLVRLSCPGNHMTILQQPYAADLASMWLCALDSWMEDRKQE